MADASRPMQPARTRTDAGVEAALVALLALEAAALLFAVLNGLWVVDAGGLRNVDFAEFWGAARLTAEGRPAAAYDWPLLRTAVAGASRAAFPLPYPFFYPPPALALLAPLGRLAPAAAALILLGLGGAAYGAALRVLAPRREAILLAFAAPAVLYCALLGQNGLLWAGLLALGAALSDRRPLLAGAAFGLLALKPQFALLAPVALLAGGRWRALAAAAAAGTGLALVTLPCVGLAAWRAFLAAATGPGPFASLPLAKVQSLYALLRLAGAPAAAALAGQLALSAGAALAVARLWRGPASRETRCAALLAAAFLATPYACVYDGTLVALAAAILLGAREAPPRGARRWALLAAVALPAGAAVAPFPYGCPAALTVLGVALAADLSARRAAGRALDPEGRPSRAPAPPIPV